MPRRRSSSSSRSSSSRSSSSSSSEEDRRRRRRRKDDRYKTRRRRKSKTRRRRRHRSPSSSPDYRRRRRDRERSRSRTRSKSPKAPVFASMSQNPSSETAVVEKLRRDRAIEEIESGGGFTPATFKSSAKEKLANISLPGEVGANDGFAFGTAIETSAKNRVTAQIERDGLCHPNLFQPQEEREKRWIKKLFKLRQSLLKE